MQITRSRSETLALIAAAWARLVSGGWLTVEGDRGDGIDGIWRHLRKHLPSALSEPKAHGRVIWVARDDTALPPWEAALEPQQSDAGDWVTAGVFSEDAPDPGSAALAALMPPLSGDVADLGAGWGWLARAVLAASPEITALDLIEAEARALDCARRNVPDSRARFYWGDATAHRGGYDTVIMNPPFHAGRRADPRLGQAFIAAAARMLVPRGTLWMVANRQLAYEDTLTAHFQAVDRVSQSNQFKIFRAEKPRRLR